MSRDKGDIVLIANIAFAAISAVSAASSAAAAWTADESADKLAAASSDAAASLRGYHRTTALYGIHRHLHEIRASSRSLSDFEQPATQLKNLRAIIRECQLIRVLIDDLARKESWRCLLPSISSVENSVRPVIEEGESFSGSTERENWDSDMSTVQSTVRSLEVCVGRLR